MRTKVCIRTVGCRTNKADSEEMARRLREGGCVIVDGPADADWVVVNSCTVTRAADRDSRREAYRARREGADPRVIVVGCMPKAQGTDAPWADTRTVLVADRDAAVAQILSTVPGAGAPGGGAGGPPALEPATHRHYIKIQEGCDQRCRYCIVPDARGSARSVPEAAVIEAVHRAAAAGHQDVVLTGTHVGRWGEDLAPPRDLAHLVARVAAEAGPGQRFRLSSLEPQDCTPGILEILRPPLCPHLHLPLQGGTDTVLRRMGRPYRTADFARLVGEARRRHGPLLCIGADVIAGFPGETDAEFEAGLGFVESLDLSYLHVFTFSPRPGTPAASDPDPIPAEVAKHRTRRLRALGEARRAAFAAAMVGQTLEVFIEGPDPGGGLRGLTENYLRAVIRGGGLPAGRWTRVLVDGAAEGILYGAAAPPCV